MAVGRSSGIFKKKKSPLYRDFDDTSRDKEEQLVDGIVQITTMYPGSSKFLGKNIIYPSLRRKKLFMFEKKLPDLAPLRECVSAQSSAEAVHFCREEIWKLKQKFSYFPDVHALNAIQTFNDTAQSGLADDRMDVERRALIEMTNALHNGGTSIFNVIWFIKIYMKYLTSLNTRIMGYHGSASKHYRPRIRSFADQLHQQHRQLLSLLTVRDKFSGVNISTTFVIADRPG